MAQLTPKGYLLKPQNEWFAEERALYTDIDPAWNLDPSTPDGLKIAHDSEIFGALDETLQQAYNSKDPNKAVGIDLDIISAITGTIRNIGTRSSAVIRITGNNGTVIPAGYRIESAQTGTRWITESESIISAGYAENTVYCTVVGQNEAPAGTLTKLVDVVGGVVSVTNPSPAVIGTNAQTDTQLRIERASAVGRPGNNQVDSAIGELFSVDDVRRVKAYENDTGSAAVSPDNPHGLPAHSMSYVVDGGTDEDVAMAIYLKKNPGVRLNQAGTPVAFEVQSPVYPGQKKLIRFGRPIYVDIVVSVVIKDDGSLPAEDIVRQSIKDAFMEFAGGELVPADVGFKITGFDIGESVPYSSCFTPVNKVIGAYGNSYVQLMTVNGGTSVVPIAFDRMARWATDNITVTVV